MKKKWWHDKTAYQIYPKSFFDTDGDGIGDLPGIIEKLDYLKSLGVDIVWLSPIYRSPLADQGYDISDYYCIDPRFGTMEDMERLLAEAKKRDMYVVMDLVVNHCSDEHEWFRKACEDPEGEYGKFFYLRKLKKKPCRGPADGSLPETDAMQAGSSADRSGAKHAGSLSDDPQAGKEDSSAKIPCDEHAGRQTDDPQAGKDEGSPDSQADRGEGSPDSRQAGYAVCSPDGYILPCNWRSYFGGPVWEKLPGHEDWFYLHVFHRKQPDLNWENPKLREEIYRMINWWLDKGLAGFRIDAIINIKKVLPFRNYAPDRADGLCSIHRMLSDAEGIGAFLGELRDRTFAPHNAFTVGEVFNEKEEELPDFIGDNGYFSTMFDFAEAVWGSSPEGWHAAAQITPDDYRACLFSAQERVRDIGFLSNIIENHDEPRGVSRYIPAADLRGMDAGLQLTAKKALATVYFFVRGLPWIYQGQEIGMENLPLHSIEEVDDIASRNAWEVMRGLGISGEDALRAIERNGRDNARTPFQWTGGHAAGFTTGTPWLQVNPNYSQINLEQQLADPASVFHHYRRMTVLRRDPVYRETLVYGSFEPYLADDHNVIAYLRRSQSQTLLVLSNYQKEDRTLPLPADVRKILLDNCAEAGSPAPVIQDGRVALTGYRTLVLELAQESAEKM